MIRLTWQCYLDDNDKNIKTILETLKTDASAYVLKMGDLYNEGKGAMFIDEELVHPNPENVLKEEKNVIDQLIELEKTS